MNGDLYGFGNPTTTTVTINGHLVGPITCKLSDLISFDDVKDDLDYVKVVDTFTDFNEVIGYHHVKGIMPDRVIFTNEGATVLFNDDKKVVVKCGEDDTYSKMLGFLYGYFLMNSGMSKNQAHKFFDKFIEDVDMPITKESKKEKDNDKALKDIVNDKSLTLDEFEERMRKTLDDYMA